ncbi:MAG: exopolysaccharide biosynthesis polyprenyl glycosylphosphotransferase [Amphiplicatus sp.]
MTSLAAAPFIVALIALAIGLGAPAFPWAEAPSKRGRVDLAALAGADFRRSARQGAANGLAAGKRLVDIAAALALVILFAPLALLLAAAIKIDGPGPVLYRQRRIGLGGKTFEILKFRSMAPDAEQDGPKWADVNDSRVTRVGRLMRRFHLDEIPQAVNVLRGEMSFVGPRPERPEFVSVLEKEIPNYHLRHMVRPGITGWAQINYVYGASVEDARIKLQYDLYYIQHFSLLRDILIMLLTMRVALFGLGGR